MPQLLSQGKPFQVPPSGGISSTTFGNRLVVDSSWIQLETGRQCVLTMCDEATRYIAVRILQSEKSTEFVKGLERTWVRHFGLPKYLRVDAAKGWESKAVRDWCSDQGVILEVAPPQSHSLELSSDDIKSFAELWNSTWMTKGVTLSPCSKMQPSTFRQSSTGCLLQQALLQINGCWGRLHNKTFL